MNNDRQDDAVTQLNELGQLAAGVGHHVINAFAAVVSNAEILKLLADAPRSIESANIADTIIKASIDASGVARRLIDYSRTATAPGAGQVALDRLVANVVEHERAAWPSDVEWSLNLVPVPPIRGNVIQLAAMVGHLLTNAREALPPTGGSILLATGRDERGWIVLEVRDSGRGMSAQEAERAVEPFFTTKPGHLGVGLSIANGIWRRHQGTLAIRSHGDEGTRVRLCVEPT